MTLPETLPLVFDSNARITRRKWANRSIFVELHESQLSIKGHPNDGQWHPWVITDEDWFADDWEVME